jgi:three-Cys-motif partner protein
MSDRIQSFGGKHTRRKLDVVAKYLAAYVTVMKKQDFRLFYVDGFAGSGACAPKSEVENEQDPTLFPTAEVLDGSPVRALSIEPPFDHYIFIEKKDENVRSLGGLIGSQPGRPIEIAPGDANERLIEVCKRISEDRLNRAVVFLDPFGLSVRWKTIEELGATKKVDLWYLVPVDGMSRQIKDDGTFLPGASKIDDLWGSAGWRSKAVREVDTSRDLLAQSMSASRRSLAPSNFLRCSAITSKTFSPAEWRILMFRWEEDGGTSSRLCSRARTLVGPHRKQRCALRTIY